MTETKGKRLLQELIAKYGDVVVAKMYDYYGVRIIHDVKSGWRYSKDPEEMIVDEIRLSELESVSSWDDYKKLEQLCQGKAKPTLIPIEVESSKQEYESESQQLARKKAHQNFQAFLSSDIFSGQTFHTYEALTRMAPIWKESSPSPKQYGQAIAGRRK